MHNEATSSTEEIIGSAEAASLLGINRSTLSRWAKSGKLEPVVKGNGVRGNYFFRRQDIEGQLAAERSQAAPA